MNNKFLPVGTVVLLKDAKKKIMVSGFCCISDGKMYDYVGSLYPEGFVSKDNVLLFNHEDIGKIFYLGFANEENTNFMSTLNNLLTEYKKKEGETVNEN